MLGIGSHRNVLSDFIDSCVQDFLTTHINSIGDLEVLLALVDGGARWWDVPSMAAQLGIPVTAARRALDALAASNLLAIRVSDDIRYQLQPGNADLEERVQQFVAAYRKSPVSVLRWVDRRSRAGNDVSPLFQFKNS